MCRRGRCSGFELAVFKIPTLPAKKDVVIMPKWGSATLLVPVMDYDGMTMFHCHIIEHEDIGMMGAWHIMDGGMPM